MYVYIYICILIECFVPQWGEWGDRQRQSVQQWADRGGSGEMYPGDQPRSGQCAAHLPSPRHVCPLQGRHEPGTGLSGQTLLIIITKHSAVISSGLFCHWQCKHHHLFFYLITSAEKWKQVNQKDFHNTAGHQTRSCDWCLKIHCCGTGVPCDLSPNVF